MKVDSVSETKRVVKSVTLTMSAEEAEAFWNELYYLGTPMASKVWDMLNYELQEPAQPVGLEDGGNGFLKARKS